MPTHKFTLRQVLQAGLMFSLFVLPVAALAQSTGFPSGMQTQVATLTVYIISAMNLLTWILFIFMTILLDPEFIFNTQNGNGFETVLNNIWMLARDLVNIGFALALIGAAVYTIITTKKDFVMTHLKTFVMAVILVNFSWFVPRVIIDIGNVAAATVYGIPSLLQNQGIAGECRFKTGVKMGNDVSCNVIAAPPPANPGDPVPPTQYDCKCAMLSNAEFFLDSNTATTLENGGAWVCPLGAVMCLHFVDLDPNAISGHSAILNGLIVNHARLQGLAGVPPINNSSEVGAMIVFMLRTMMVLVIHAALFFPLAAMVVAFAIRIPVLWITVAFMPFAILKFILPGSYAEYPLKIWNYFLQAAMLPAMVAAPLSVGFILVNAGVQFTHAPLVKINMKLVDGVSNLFELLWLGLTLAVLYFGVFMVLKSVGFAAPVAGMIEGMGKSLGGLALKLPLSFPVIPGPGGKSISPLYLDNMVRSVSSNLSNNPRGIMGVAEEMKNGNMAGGFGGHAKAAGQFASGQNLHELRTLNTKISEMTNKIKAGETPDYAQFAREINSGLKEKIHIDQANPESSLRSFMSELSKHNVDQSVFSGLETSINQFGSTIRSQQPKP